MRQLGIDSAVIVGYSDGGIIGIDMAIHHPERVTKLAVTGANSRADGYTAENLEWARTGRSKPCARPSSMDIRAPNSTRAEAGWVHKQESIAGHISHAIELPNRTLAHPPANGGSAQNRRTATGRSRSLAWTSAGEEVRRAQAPRERAGRSLWRY
jgi:pimeloyl-ACP methyl ester carboxylesterase